MKCQQKSCQRNKNINLTTGLCNVCEEVVQETTNKVKKKDQTKIMMKKVEIDYKEMVKMYEKLSKGEINDPAVVNGLILGGIINILVQHDTIVELDAKVKAMEEVNKTNENRIESLETWNCKQTEEINRLANHIETLDKNGVIVKENNEFTNLKKKLTNLEIDMLGLKSLNLSKSQQEKVNSTTSGKSAKKARKTCGLCENTFSENCDLEFHMRKEHEVENKYKCDQCDKDFFLEWRRNMHMKVHTDGVKYCHFYNNNKQCPYEDLGCMFLHITAEQCTFQNCKNQLCQFRHDKLIENVDEKNDEEVDKDYNDVEEEPINKNQCHLCMNQMDSEDKLWNHIDMNHEEYFNGLMEAAAMSSKPVL